ncbi:hypothetical protein AB0D59_43895 [Streptomyces sp. NPDC048417]|uniref:hypothetical protein n=1 Tax=Streptomyces sp. NPDC048417 TaxID=3155387 RepID=UPI003438CBD5
MTGIPAEQVSLRLTPHPLQRVGAFALAAFAGARHPDMVAGPLFEAAAEKVTAAAVRAALVRDTKAEAGFLLKCSYSLWPNSKMNHPRNKKLSDAEVTEAVRAWRTIPAPQTWPGTGCVLCGAVAVGFYGKSDVVLAESVAYRNSTPRGHAGLALCWPCVCSFHSVPFGSQLTGGPSTVVHTWDERFAAHTVDRQVQRNGLLITLGAKPASPQADVAVLAALRGYEHRVTAGVELLVFTNNNQDQVLTSHAVDQPLAEWLRTTTRLPDRRTGFACLLRSLRTDKNSGAQNLAWRVFHRPESIPGVLASYLTARTEACGRPAPESPAVAELAGSYLHEVMHMEEKDLAEIRATAQRVAALFKPDDTGGQAHRLSRPVPHRPRRGPAQLAAAPRRRMGPGPPGGRRSADHRARVRAVVLPQPGRQRLVLPAVPAHIRSGGTAPPRLAAQRRQDDRRGLRPRRHRPRRHRSP